MFRIFCVVLVMGLFFWSCADDDNGIPGEVVPPRLLADQVIEDDAAIQEFLRTHTYNYEEFENPPTDFDFKIKIETLSGENSDKIPLSDFPELGSATINVSSDQLNLSEEENNIGHTYYFLEVREGGGSQPTANDSTLLKYEGLLLNGEPFDASTNFLWQQLPFTVRGYGNGISQFNAGTSDQIDSGSDGKSSIANSGIGIIIMPSGLGYFGSPPVGSDIPAYSPLVFTIEVGLFVEDTDTDNDGIPNTDEDLNGNGYLFDDNTDQQLENNARVQAIANFRDADDDGDGILTRDEIEIDGDGNITFPDSDGDGTPDYLDADN